MFINLLLPNYPLLQIKNNIIAAANRLFLPNYLFTVMAYKDFTLERLELEFGIKNKRETIFNQIQTVEASDWLLQTLALGKTLPIRSEKSRSELIVAPVLVEIKHRNLDFITFYSGERLDADRQHGLVGECDFIIARETGSYSLNLPLLAVVEAKKQDIDLGINQCAAQLCGAKIFNESRKNSLPVLYGCVTTGEDWLFMKLEQNILKIDTQKYNLQELPVVLGIFQTIIDFYRK
ncbi:MAG: hypothetical protein EAZ32_15355 [Cytophagia bacterium]|nr:MAG: hypothetical protein EAZ32_15355 [Cytophagia bacterium]